MVDRRTDRSERCPFPSDADGHGGGSLVASPPHTLRGPPLAAAVRLIGPVGAAVIRSTTGFLWTWIPMLVLA